MNKALFAISLWTGVGFGVLTFAFPEKGMAAKVVSLAVAQASDHVVTSREVQISYIMDQVLNTKLSSGSEPAKLRKDTWLLDPKSELFQKHLAQVLLELVVTFEAENFSIGQVSPTEVKSYMDHLERMTRGWKIWNQLEVTPLESEQMVLRKLRSKNFLKFKEESSSVAITDEEAKRYFEKNKAKFGNHPYPRFAESIKEYLSQTQKEEKMKEWFELLKRKYRVKILGQVE